MSVGTALVAGSAIGVRHALETDHLAAIATLVEGDEHSSATVGASWGVGHAVPIATFGLLFLALGVRLPDSVAHVVEGLVGVVLVALGLRMLLVAADVVAATAHGHGRGGHRHRRLGRVSVGPHLHLDGDSALVGVLHGVAGSGTLVVAMVAASPSVPGAMSFLAAFSFASVLTMAAVSLAWGHSLEAGLRTPLRLFGGLVGIAVGALLLANVAGLGLTSVPSLPFLH